MDRVAETGERHEARARASASVHARPLWRIKLARELPRLLLLGVSCAGLVASARFAIAPPRVAAPVRSRPAAPARDLAAEGFAQLFARRYLTWEANDPEAHQRALASYIGAGMEPGAGAQPPVDGEEQVQWTEVVQERAVLATADTAAVTAAASSSSSSSSSGSESETEPDERVYTVAAQTDVAGLVYLAVRVARAPGGALELVGYPAFVGAPVAAPAIALAGSSREVSEPALHTVVERALRNYLADAGAELDADLTDGARVSLPTRALDLEGVQRLDWSPVDGDAVSAIVQAGDGHGARYTLAYELDVAQVAGRWEVAAIEMDPDA